MITAQLKTKLDGTKALFDVQTQTTVNGKFDLVINPQGQLNRIIGIDKLAQHVNKYILVRKGFYLDSSIGTAIHSPTFHTQNELSLKTDIINSLKTYSNYQIESSKTASDKILGWDIYRTMDPSDNETWVKLNKYLISNNFYYDNKNIKSGETYYYSVVSVTNENNRPNSEGIGAYMGITIPYSNTLNAEVGTGFIIIPRQSSVTLYWQKPVYYYAEEMLRSITKLLTWTSPSDPRALSIYIQMTNIQKATTDVLTNVIK